MTNQKKSKQNDSAGNVNHSELERFFVDALKDIYWAEKTLTKTLPRIQKAVTSENLKQAIGEHTAQTEEHVKRLEKAFELLGQTARAKKCEAMEGLIKEGNTVIEETEEGSHTRDVGIIMAAQKVEHYEIATYGGLVTLAKIMGQQDIGELLGKTLEEEKLTDLGLTELAENNINEEAEMEA